MDRILLADDDIAFCSLLQEYLSGQGFVVTAVHDGVAAIQAVRTGAFDLLVLDVMMPRADGFKVLEQLRATQHIPVLMLTARGDDVDRIVGLELGADDYVGKPCNPRELAARIRAIIRRVRPATTVAAPPLRCGALELQPAARSARLGDAELALTAAEFDVLRVLVEEAGQVVAKDALARRALNRPLGTFDRSIDMHVSRLRTKLAGNAQAPEIRTVRNRGYLLALEA